MPAPTREIPTPVNGPDPADTPGDLSRLFPSIIPEVEQIVYERVHDAASSRAIFPQDGSGLALPAAFSIPPDLSLYKDKDGTYTIPVGEDKGKPVPPIPVTRGWPAYPGSVPAIGVAESTSEDDESEDAISGGFAGDVFAYDQLGNVIATAAYYAEPMQVTVIVELIHENRDERDRLHDQLRRVIFPLKHLIAEHTPQVRKVTIGGEKQDLPQDELPRPIYVSLFTVTVSAEALIPTEITPSGVITELDVTVTPTPSP